MSENSEGAALPMEGDGQTEGLFSVLDFFILSAMAGFAVYWFIFRNRKKEEPTFKQLKVS